MDVRSQRLSYMRKENTRGKVLETTVTVSAFVPPQLYEYQYACLELENLSNIPSPHLTKWCAMTRVSASSYLPTKNPPTSLCNSVKSSFRDRLKERKSRGLFDSVKRIRYRLSFWRIQTTKFVGPRQKRAVKFNKRQDGLNHSVTVQYI